MTERIIAAAVHLGITVSLPPPARHHTILRALLNWTKYTPQPHEQGFLTDAGRFVTREEAHDLAWRSGQCGSPQHPTQLFSEDLW